MVAGKNWYMKSFDREAFLKDLRKVMKKHGVSSMEAFFNVPLSCFSLFDKEGNGLLDIYRLDRDPESLENRIEDFTI